MQQPSYTPDRADDRQVAELVRITRLMREQQSNFFKGDKPAMATAKQLEKQCDLLLAQFPDPNRPVQAAQPVQGSLFSC